MPHARFEHFEHVADIGVRGFGATLAEAFEQAALAMMAVVTDEPVAEKEMVEVTAEAPDREILLAEFLNALIYEMSIKKMIFARFEVETDGRKLTAKAYGEPVEQARHEPAVEIKGATLTELKVREQDGKVMAQCVVDV